MSSRLNQIPQLTIASHHSEVSEINRDVGITLSWADKRRPGDLPSARDGKWRVQPGEQ
jgi:hypothetical protein